MFKLLKRFGKLAERHILWRKKNENVSVKLNCINFFFLGYVDHAMVKQSKKKLTGENVVLINLILLALLEKALMGKFTKRGIRIQVNLKCDASWKVCVCERMYARTSLCVYYVVRLQSYKKALYVVTGWGNSSLTVLKMCVFGYVSPQTAVISGLFHTLLSQCRDLCIPWIVELVMCICKWLWALVASYKYSIQKG